MQQLSPFSIFLDTLLSNAFLTSTFSTLKSIFFSYFFGGVDKLCYLHAYISQTKLAYHVTTHKKKKKKKKEKKRKGEEVSLSIIL